MLHKNICVGYLCCFVRVLTNCAVFSWQCVLQVCDTAEAYGRHLGLAFQVGSNKGPWYQEEEGLPHIRLRNI